MPVPWIKGDTYCRRGLDPFNSIGSTHLPAGCCPGRRPQAPEDAQQHQPAGLVGHRWDVLASHGVWIFRFGSHTTWVVDEIQSQISQQTWESMENHVFSLFFNGFCMEIHDLP